MIELEFLGLDAKGEKLTFNDSDGNRYEATISEELRGALRKDLKPVTLQSSSQSLPKAASPKEIQAYFRSGMSIAEVSEICTLPPLQLAKLASPIQSERKFIADQARQYQKNQDSAEMTVDELVTSRLLSRGVEISSINWDAVREAGAPWVLLARYIVAGTETEARWQVNTKAHFITPLNDEATWLTDTPIPAPNDPWRPLNIPKVTDLDHSKSFAELENQQSGVQSQQLPTAEVERLAKLSHFNDDGASVDNSANTQIDIDAVLASLDEQRGVAQPVPSFESDSEFQGAHPAFSEPEMAQDAQILRFPGSIDDAHINAQASRHQSNGNDDSQLTAASLANSKANSEESKTSNPHSAAVENSQTSSSTANTASPQPPKEKDDKGVQALPGLEKTNDEAQQSNDKPKEKPKAKPRRGRPEMPSWDEIIYGYSKDGK